MPFLLFQLGDIKSNDKDIVKSCHKCGMSYRRWTSYEEHLKTCSGSKHAEKDSAVKLTKESEDDDSLGRTKCVICLKKFQGSKDLRLHMEQHQAGPSREASNKCNICQKTFPDKGKLICHNALAHRARTTPVKPLVKPDIKKLHCDPCNEEFQNSGDFICHQVLVHKKK